MTITPNHKMILGGKWHAVFRVLSDNKFTDSAYPYLIVKDMDNAKIYKKVVFEKNVLMWLGKDANGERLLQALTAAERKRYTRRILKAVKTYHQDHYQEQLKDPHAVFIR